MAFQCSVMTPLQTFRSEQHNRAEPVEIWKARKLIEQHSGEKLSLTRVAEEVNTSANYLSEKFKRVTGTNFVHYVARIRIENARALLKDVDLGVSEIAFAVGFQSLSQFNRAFKKLVEKSPTEFRATFIPHMKASQTKKIARVNRQSARMNGKIIFRKNA